MGFVTVTPTSGMIADAIAPPRRDLPADLSCARVSSDETRQAFADLNAMSYAIPLETGRQGPARACFWDNSFHGYVALLGGEPVSAAMTAPMDGRLYVSWVATHPEHRRKGYADAVMRKSLESAHLATGFTRTALHATPDGQPMYERMGYRSIAGFSLHAVA
jgi:ribosomal protein S18 acetylase RimI-like enzyme